MNIVTVSHLCKRYGQRESSVLALNDVSFTLAPQSFTAMVGRSGCGKTTLLNVLGGLEVPTSGQVQIFGENPYQMKDSARTQFRRRHIGYVFQCFNLIPELTVYENVCLPSFLDGREPDAKFICHVLQKLGIAAKKDKFPAELSGGEQQRVAVARALSCKPALVLADEPTGNLDKKSGDELMQLLYFSHRFFEQTILLVTHELSIARTAQRIITLEDGRIVSDVSGDRL